MRALRAGELLDHAFHRLAEQVPVRDRAWVQELVYGTVRLRGRIDYLLAQFVRRSFESLEPDVIDILRLGAYQLLEMGSVPAYAAVSQAVEMTKATAGLGAKGLVNGVLQSLRRAQPELQPPPQRNALEFLSTWGSHPRWLVERWLRTFGRESTQTLIDRNNERPDLYVRAVGSSIDDAITRLHDRGITAERVADVPDALQIPSSDVAPALAAAPLLVQDPAASLVVRYADFGPEPVADLCAAPGGKALAIAGAQDKDAFVIAGDVSIHRLLKVRENAQRVGNNSTVFVVADARRPALRQVPQILVDAPCTGTGTLRRHPDGKWRVTAEDLGALASLQREILTSAAALLSPGGLLVYATCSIEPEENEQQIGSFLEQQPEFELEPPRSLDGKFLDAAGQLRVLPHEHGFDGAFAARLRKRA